MFSIINRAFVLPLTGFALGTISFLEIWPKEVEGYEGPVEASPELIRRWRSTRLYQELRELAQWRQSEIIPVAHRRNHVGQGLLGGTGKIENDPMVFHNEAQKSMCVVYQLGKELGDSRGYVHNGVLSVLLDEVLCYCGFPALPNKRGVTAQLELDFVKKIPVDSAIVLKAQVVEHKGRKCVISGTLESIPGMEKSWWGRMRSVWGGECYARAKCVLVEPRWFKWMPTDIGLGGKKSN